MEQTVAYFFNGTGIIKFKAKDSGIVANPLCLGIILEDFSADNMKKAGLIGSVYDFSVVMMILQLVTY